MKKSRLLLLLIFLTVLNSLSAKNASLYGVVSQQNTKQALSDISVYFSGTNKGTTTNTQGEYSLNNIKPGKYTIIVSALGYSRVKKIVTITNGRHEINFTLKKIKHSLGEVVVTGTGTAHHLSKTPIETEVISSKQIKATGANRFTDLMTRTSPSFDFTSGGMGDFMTLNGLKNDFILILIDGKRIYGDIGGNNDLNRIDLDNIKQIEIVKGASSLLYGSDAIAGVVNIITKKSKRKVDITNTSKISSYNTYTQSNSIKLNLGKITSITNYNHTRSDGWQLSKYEITKGETSPTEKKNQNAYNTDNISQRLGLDITDKLSVYGNGSYYQKNLLYPESTKKYGFFYKDLSYGAGAKYLLNSTDYISFDFNSDNYKYYYKYNQDYKNYTDGQKAIQNDQYMQEYNIKSVNTLSSINKLTTGINVLNEKIKSERILSGEKSAYTLAAYAQDEWKIIKALEVVAGLRFVKHENFGTKLTPKISAIYKLKHFNFRGTYGLGFKAPTLKDMYYVRETKGNRYAGDPNLKSQDSQYKSLGVEYHGGIGTISLTAYRNNVNDLIEWKEVELTQEDIADGIKKRKVQSNIDKARTQGVDFLYNSRSFYGFNFGAGYSYVDAKDTKNDVRLERVAQNYANTYLNYNRCYNKYHYSINLSGRYQDGKFYEEGSTEPYSIWTLTTIHDFYQVKNFKFKFTAGIDNIFDYSDDSPYGEYHSTLTPGRTVFAGITINFLK